MSFWDLLLKVKADVNDAGRGFDSLKGKISGFADHASKAIFTVNQSLELMQRAVAGLEKALDFAKFAGNLQQLESIVGKGIAGRLQAAVDGTITKVDALKLAAKGMTGEFRLTEEGMAKVLRVADELGDRGFGETTEIAQRLMDTLRRGRVEGLKEFGIEIETSTDKMKNMKATWQAFEEVLANPAATNHAGDKMEAFAVKLQDAVDKAKRYIGEVIIKVVEFFDNFKAFFEAMVDTMEAGIERLLSPLRAVGLLGKTGAEAVESSIIKPAAIERTAARLGLSQSTVEGAVNVSGYLPSNNPILQEYQRQLAQARRENAAYQTQRERSAAHRQLGPLVTVEGEGAMYEGKVMGRERRGGGYDASSYEAVNMELTYDQGQEAAALAAEFQGEYVPYGGGVAANRGAGYEGRAGRGSRPEDLLGLGMDFDLTAKQNQLESFAATMEMLHDRTTAAGGAFGAFADGVSAAVGAAIDGHKSLGAAFKQAAGAALKSLAIESTVRALYETAAGLAALATPVTAPSAGPHFMAAAKFAATAVAAGLGASALGGGGGGYGGGGGGSPSTAAGGGYAGGGGGGRTFEGSNITYIQVGDGFVGKPEELAEAIDHNQRQGRRSGVIREAIGPVRFN